MRWVGLLGLVGCVTGTSSNIMTDPPSTTIRIPTFAVEGEVCGTIVLSGSEGTPSEVYEVVLDLDAVTVSLDIEMDEAGFGQVAFPAPSDCEVVGCSPLAVEVNGQVQGLSGGLAPPDLPLLVDSDADGWYVESDEQVCSRFPTSVAEFDCDDDDVAIHPRAVERCDSIDHNCDGRSFGGLGVQYTSSEGTTSAGLPLGALNGQIDVCGPLERNVTVAEELRIVGRTLDAFVAGSMTVPFGTELHVDDLIWEAQMTVAGEARFMGVGIQSLELGPLMTIEPTGGLVVSGGFVFGASQPADVRGRLRSENVMWDQNTSPDSGGAIRVRTGGDLVVVDSSFSGNEAVDGGGAIWVDAGAVASVQNTSFHNNFAARGGGMGSLGATDFGVGVSFSDNVALGKGGGLWLNGEVADAFDLVIDPGTTFSDNFSTDGGGAIYLAGSPPGTLGGQFIANMTGGNGGAVLVDGNGADVDVSGFFTSNEAEDGSAVFVDTRGLVSVSGDYLDNVGDGGVVTARRMSPDADLTGSLCMSGAFMNNDGAGVEVVTDGRTEVRFGEFAGASTVVPVLSYTGERAVVVDDVSFSNGRTVEYDGVEQFIPPGIWTGVCLLGQCEPYPSLPDQFGVCP